MKCVKNTKTGVIKRVPDSRAKEMVQNGHGYVPKKEHKAQNRKQVTNQELHNKQPEQE
jgi:hypothetical protein